MVVAGVLLVCTLFGLLIRVSDGFKNMDSSTWTLHEINEDNLYQKLSFSDERKNDGSGLTVQYGDDNELKTSGTTVEAVDYVIGTINLSKGTYQIDPGFAKNQTKDTYWMTVSAGDTTLATLYGGATSFEVTADDTVVTFTLNVNKGVNMSGVSIKPVMSVGERASDLVSFYK